MAGAGETLHPIDTLPASPCPGVKGALQAGLTVGLCPRTPLASCSSAALCLRRGGTSTTTPSSLTKTLNPKTLNPSDASRALHLIVMGRRSSAHVFGSSLSFSLVSVAVLAVRIDLDGAWQLTNSNRSIVMNSTVPGSVLASFCPVRTNFYGSGSCHMHSLHRGRWRHVRGFVGQAGIGWGLKNGHSLAPSS